MRRKSKLNTNLEVFQRLFEVSEPKIKSESIMGKITLEVDLDQLGMTLNEWAETKIAKTGTWTHEPTIAWSNHQRNMIEGWERAGRAIDFRLSHSYGNLDEPGTYALVYDPDNTSEHPILDPRTIVFGEGTQPVRKRINHNTGALRGVTTNMNDKWSKAAPVVCKVFELEVLNPADITCFYRPHFITDPEFTKSRIHSQEMETQAHAMWQILHGHKCPANTRDLPTEDHLYRARVMLQQLGMC